MQTNEELVTGLGQAVEAELQALVRAVVIRPDAPLATLEQQVFQSVFGLGRRWLERLLAWRTAQRPVVLQKYRRGGSERNNRSAYSAEAGWLTPHRVHSACLIAGHLPGVQKEKATSSLRSTVSEQPERRRRGV